ncbi:MAG: hypothetical protein HY913_04805 [Desulfomonile tiedjei]|nr:hypothetical protein [Desulfomonile tiedjei]
MSSRNDKDQSWQLFPTRRFDPGFPLALWFAGLWFYLKSFLYVCYLYMLGLDPPPYSGLISVEIVYFAVTILPAFLLGLMLWNERKWIVTWAIVFLIIDTPVLLFHVMRLEAAGYMDSGLTKVLEFGSLVLNVVALGWLIGYRTTTKMREAQTTGARSRR